VPIARGVMLGRQSTQTEVILSHWHAVSRYGTAYRSEAVSTRSSYFLLFLWKIGISKVDISFASKHVLHVQYLHVATSTPSRVR